MSRHRDVRCMNYSDEYDGYDDVYGHSVEDDYCVSPSAEQFMFDRSKQQNIASFITEPDIVEDNEDVEESISFANKKLSELEVAKLESCMETIKNVLGDTVPESELRNKIIQSNFNAKVALNLVLEESSPKHVTESSAITKDRIEHHADATIVEAQSPSFAIPKLSFKKRKHVLGDNGINFSLTKNIESLKNLAIDNPSTSFCTLGRTATDCTNLELPENRHSSEKSDRTFNSLADLTANYLQKSLHDVQQSNNKIITPNVNFTVPKLSIKNDTFKGKSNNENIAVHKTSTTHDTESNIILDEKDVNLKSQNVKCNSTKRTPSPDIWVIDLSAALKEAECLTYHSTKNNSTTITPVEVPRSPSPTDDDKLLYPQLPTTLNLISLATVKLPHTKQNLSLFGRTLCRAWKWRKPILKYQREEHHRIKRFDFSTPYTRR